MTLAIDVDDRLREALGALGAEDLRRAVVAERGRELVGDAVADDDRVGLAAELAGEPARASETAPSEFLLNAPS